MVQTDDIPECKPDPQIKWYCRIPAETDPDNVVLSQGDIIAEVPTYVPEVPVKITEDGKIIAEEVTYDAVIVVTQSCDLTKNKENQYEINDVVVCPIYPLNQFFNDTIEDYLPKINVVQQYQQSAKKPDVMKWIVEKAAPGKIKEFKENLVKCYLTNYYLLDKCNRGIFKDDYIIVDFRGAFTISINQLLEIVSKRAERIKLNSPYVEGLSQAYGIMYMRVAHPIAIDREQFPLEKPPSDVFKLPDEYLDMLRKEKII